MSLQPNCAGADPDLFVPDIYRPADMEAAESYCIGCPMTAACLQFGRDTRSWGLWGGVWLESGRPLPDWWHKVKAG